MSADSKPCTDAEVQLLRSRLFETFKEGDIVVRVHGDPWQIGIRGEVLLVDTLRVQVFWFTSRRVKKTWVLKDCVRKRRATSSPSAEAEGVPGPAGSRTRSVRNGGGL